ncbi:MAG: hypothetical protein ACXVNO_08670 [Bacteroidia bacterium]
MRALFKIGFGLLLFMFLPGCTNKEVIVEEYMFGSPRTENGGKWLEDSVYKNHKFCRMDSSVIYGPRYVYEVKEQDRGKEIWLTLTGKVRTNFVHTTGAIIYEQVDDKKVWSWDGSNFHYHITDLNKWCYFKERIKMPKASKDFPYTKIRIQPIIGTPGKELLDVDSIKILLTIAD